MAVTSVKEDWRGWESRDATNSRSAPRIFTVVFNDKDAPASRPILAKKARDPKTKLSIPQKGNQHPYDRGMYVKDIYVEQDEGPFNFKVICTYSSLSGSGGQGAENPLDEKPDINWTFATSNEKIDRDINGNAITNSAGQSFDPPISKDFHDLVLKYVRNEEKFDPLEARKYKGHINSETFLGWPEGTVMCTVFNGDKIYNDEFKDYYRVTYEFQFRLDKVGDKEYGWQRRILDEGLYEKDGTNGDGTPKLVAIKDDDGQPVSAPVPLNGSGSKKKASADDVFLTFDIFPKASFSKLNIKI